MEHVLSNASVKLPCEHGVSARRLSSVSSMRVLVVEDEVDLAHAVATGLRREGYAVDVANDGDAALEKLGYTEYDVVCLDLTLPKVDGTEVCRRIRSGATASTGARILMLTARDAVADRVKGLDEGADDYLVKPFAFAELTARVRTLLRRDAGRTGARMNRIVLDGDGRFPSQHRLDHLRKVRIAVAADARHFLGGNVSRGVEAFVVRGAEIDNGLRRQALQECGNVPGASLGALRGHRILHDGPIA